MGQVSDPNPGEDVPADGAGKHTGDHLLEALTRAVLFGRNDLPAILCEFSSGDRGGAKHRRKLRPTDVSPQIADHERPGREVWDRTA
jgi:hypothetical protein